MLTDLDIKSIVGSGEGYNAEFKVRVPAKVKELTEEVCAFANAAGGVLLLGVDDDNKIQGIQINNSKRSAIQDSLNQINPNLYCPFYFVEVDGKQVGVIEVPSGLQKPYTLSGSIFIRQCSNSQKITSVEQMRDFFQQSGRIYFDEGSCNSFLYENDFHKGFFKEFRIISGFSTATDDWQIIRNLQLLNEDKAFKNGSVLFFGKQPETFFEKAVIRCVAFEGTDKVQIIDDKVWGGHLMQQYYDAMRWLKTKLSVRYIIEGSGPRKEVWEIPETALKESIINALSHRDYY
ncbi:MAG: putative DNA binding domain-containing protein, partial [Bacteroidales bacterium]|nr:putative DNA binding domain-containing protein [Bacteroidales bacterium]